MATNNSINLAGKMPAFSAKNTSTQTFTSGGSPATVLFPTKLFDITTSYNASTYTFTAPLSGYYLFGTAIPFTRGFADGLDTIELVTTGGTFLLNRLSPLILNEVSFLNGSLLCNMAVSDTCYVSFSTTSSGSIVTDVVSGTPAFWGYMVALI